MYQQRCWSTLGQPDHGFHQPLSEVGESHGLVKAGREILPKGDKPLAQIIAIPNHHANNHAVNSAQSANLAMSRCNKAVSRAFGCLYVTCMLRYCALQTNTGTETKRLLLEQLHFSFSIAGKANQ